MSDDWKVGDLAVCVDARPNCVTGQANPCKLGAVYTVERIVFDTSGVMGLGLVGVEFPNCSLNADVATRFRKIRPDEHEPCEEEFRILLKLSKKRVQA
jgi:hypothetical protein